MDARGNPRWTVDDVVVDVDPAGDGTWDYKVTLAEDGTTLLVEEGFASEEDALRDALREVPGLPDVQHLREGARLFRPPDHEQTQYAVWWSGLGRDGGPARSIDDAQVVVEVDDDCVRKYEWFASGYDPYQSEQTGHWKVATVCPDPEPSSIRLRAGAAQKIFDEFGGFAEDPMSDEAFAKHFEEMLPSATPNPPHALDPHAFNAWLSFVVYAVVGQMREADGLLREHGDAIGRAAAQIQHELPVSLRPQYRGILVSPSAVEHGLIRRDRQRLFESFSENRDVACWFASRDTVISQQVVELLPSVRGYLVEQPKPDPALLLWHHRWTEVPMPGDPRRFPLLLAALELQRRTGQVDARQFEWNMRTQQEVIMLPAAKSTIRVKPVSDCPAADELDARFTYPPFLR